MILGFKTFGPKYAWDILETYPKIITVEDGVKLADLEVPLPPL